MVSTEKCYKTDNFPVLRRAVLSDDYLYQVRLYMERAVFMSAESGVLRMKVLLGFIEAKAVVIDAVIKTEGSLHYLSVICSSGADPVVFSGILKRIVPCAIIEEVQHRNVEQSIAIRAVRDESWNSIPFAGRVKKIHESRRVLFSLLIEYRALIAEYANALKETAPVHAVRSSSDYAISVLIFEKDGCVCGIPDFQIERIAPGVNNSHIIQLHSEYGQHLIVCDDLVCIKEIDIVSCSFLSKKERGYYRIATSASGGTFEFTLVVPSFL